MRAFLLASLLTLVVLTPVSAAALPTAPAAPSLLAECVDPYEPNNSVAAAAPLTVDASPHDYAACEGAGSGLDYYVVHIPACQTFHLAAYYQGDTGYSNLVIELLAADGSTVLWSDQTGAYYNDVAGTQLTVAEASTFYIWVGIPGDQVSAYTLRLWREICAPGPSPTPTKTPSEPSELIARPVEAEQGAIQAPMVVRTDSAASSCGYVTSDVADQVGSAQYTFDLPKTTNYYLWARVAAADYNHNSFFYAWDGGLETYYEAEHIDAALSWGWDRMKKTAFTMAAGTHTLRLRPREPGARLDALMMVNSFPYQPTLVLPCDTITPTSTPTPSITPTPSRTPLLANRVFLPSLLQE